MATLIACRLGREEPITSDAEMMAYYAARAAEYERIYQLPERQADLARLRRLVAAYFRERRVLEVACGTGYWTAVVAPTATSVLATDAVPDTLAIARMKSLAQDKVTFRVADAYLLDGIAAAFDAALAGFWWSHVKRTDLPRFLSALHARLEPGSRVMFFDNRFVAASSTPIHRADAEGNTYQLRKLADGSTHEVLKNFPSRAELIRMIARSGGRAIRVGELRHYWVVRYRLPRGGARNPDVPALHEATSG